MQTRFLHFLHGAFFLVTAVAGVAAEDSLVQYNRDVRPILADRCFRCHGPDGAAREAELSLDRRADAIADRDGQRAIEPGMPTTSALMRRITSADPDVRMPPPESGAELSDHDVEVLRRWIADGATYDQHWSFVAPVRPVPPETTDPAWAENAIDRFVIARLKREGMVPSPEATPATLIRRVSLDLTGLPPTLPEVDAFEREWDIGADVAYRRVVDRLLTSPRYGERMATAWLDAARYADTNGYFTDENRSMWPWRDWVIRAFNDNMPFDQFTIEQLAGDMLPDASTDQQIASGFNRNHMVNNETGIIEEEYRVEYVADRVDTTATVWLGLTIGCDRCHDHKYDPVTQKDFYRLFSVFNNVPEKGLSGSQGNSAPYLKVLLDSQRMALNDFHRKVSKAEASFAAVRSQIDQAQAQWESTAHETVPTAPDRGLVGHFSFDDDDPIASRIGPVEIAAGVSGNAASFSGDAHISVQDVGNFDRDHAFSFGGWVQPSGAGCVVSKMDDANGMQGYDLSLRKGKAIVNLVHRWNQNAIRVASIEAVPFGQWRHLFVTYNGSGKAAGIRIYVDGKQQAVEVSDDNLTGSIRNSEPLRLARRQSSASYSGLMDNVRIYDRGLSPDEVKDLVFDQFVRGIIAIPPTKRNDVQQRTLRDWFVENLADENLARTATRLHELKSREQQMLKNVPTTMVMQESEKPRPTFVLVRGEYDQHGEQVTPGVPEFLDDRSRSADGKQKAEVRNRLQFAEWLVDRSNPLTARVTVNRLWQQVFGVGLVTTVDNFGIQGEWPSHPDLLDWLAVELIESGWDIKHLLRTIVTSKTYRQTARCSTQLLLADRENRLLARGPRFRMNAEMIRDNALAIGGLLTHRIGGASVKPYQPAGLWSEVTYDGNAVYTQATGESLYRRSLYTFWKRQVPPPNMVVFDAPTRETCSVQRSRTNTPLQALVLMNDPTFVEAARKLAEQTMLKPGRMEEDRIALAFRAATARRPTGEESRVLLQIYRQQREVLRSDPASATKLLDVGASTRDETLNQIEHAAWTTVASVILCLDETITKP